jgi:dGTPase
MHRLLAPLSDHMLPAAQRAGAGRGRRHPEPEHPRRNPYERDRDRIIHSAAFRRLEYKTQVFVNGEGDNYRTRLTHTLEVTQLARAIARGLRLNEDLAEAAALSHDLGHTPFGHAGERELDSLMSGAGGFNHNRQGLRVVDVLEKRYADFAGLNLCHEVREAFVRHGGSAVAEGQDEFPKYDAPLLEVAASMAADDIAYLAHDVDDGLFSGMLSAAMLGGETLWRQASSPSGLAGLTPSLQRTEGVRRLINLLVTDLLAESGKNIVRLKLDSTEAVREAGGGAVAFSPEVENNKNSLKTFLARNFYRHPAVSAVMEEARTRLRQLFDFYSADAGNLPEEYRAIAAGDGVPRAAADYIAGMTDRFAIEEWRKRVGG